jgi:hypothetical protein
MDQINPSLLFILVHDHQQQHSTDGGRISSNRRSRNSRHQ